MRVAHFILIASAVSLSSASLEPSLLLKGLQWSYECTMNLYNIVINDFEPARVDYNFVGGPTTGLYKIYNNYQWTAGFFPGILVEFQILSNSPLIPFGQWSSQPWNTMALKNMARLAINAAVRNTHDIGFIIAPSFGMAYNAFGSSGAGASASVMLQGAETLSARFVPSCGSIRSWDPWSGYPASMVQVIIDNMMTIELLLQAATLPGGKTTWRDMAVAHARTTAKFHIRSDGSAFHRVIYNAANGQVLQAGTHQGFSDSSAWSRGQAWAICGFTMVYGYTKLPDMLATAIKVSDYFVQALKSTSPDNVPIWDFRAPAVPGYKDTSAASAAACGLIELDTYAPGRGYREVAEAMVTSLIKTYMSVDMPAPQYQSILRNGTSNANGSNKGYWQGLIYGDYYLVKAIRMLTVGTPWLTPTSNAAQSPPQASSPPPRKSSPPPSPPPRPRKSPHPPPPSPPPPPRPPPPIPAKTKKSKSSPPPFPFPPPPSASSFDLWTSSHPTTNLLISAPSLLSNACNLVQGLETQWISGMESTLAAGPDSLSCLTASPSSIIASTAVADSSWALSWAITYGNNIGELVASGAVPCGGSVIISVSGVEPTQAPDVYSCNAAGSAGVISTPSLCCT